ncbi:MAG: HlyC/CorC family transporter [Pseudomonadales bacterium]|nr:HlyC/CorC family transporter [Pseudomonadales bacterium]MDG1002164.1 HlyC/CorC family transporter [Pseudomonadales bacterium]MDG1303957.1 HlyC/CorC family transporter [Pseudomonadales bacterium]MDG1835347.1 HlyC/CorC family transporter [Pseudomonadales bacterium]MDG1907472.1 HlyC/CorC family transporter [Pseudomonadales bacterium]
MDDPSIGALFGATIVLVILSAYFSGSETAMMALNRYRLKHLANEGHGGARRASRLLERPDRLLSVILIGNNLVNFTAASLATLIALELYGESGVAIAPVVCTFVFLIFAEVAPKSIAAAHPEKVALPSSYILNLLLLSLYPLVWLVNGIANGILSLIGINHDETASDHLSKEELRTVVFEGSQISAHPQNMMLGVLDLDKVSVEDIMVPRTEIFGIDIDDDIEDIIEQIRSSQHTRIPVFKADIDKIIGVLHTRNAAKFLTQAEVNKAAILQVIDESYFVPENQSLQTLLFNFQQSKQRLGMVVDEYGDVQGIVAIEDILEEIVGEFTTDLSDTNIDIHPLDDGLYLIDGSTHIRLINRQLTWDLPQEGPKTLNGLIIEYLETIPDSNVCMLLEGYRIEIVQIQDNMIKTAKISRVPEPF